jgi:DNA-binding transcriptional ArsR family regulator
VDLVAQALTDPVRRRILLLLRGGPIAAGAVAEQFPVSRPAVSRHLRVLRQAGLVRDEARGKERIYQLRLEPLAELEAYLRELRAAALWERRLDALSTEVQRVKTRRRRSASSAASLIKRKETKETA